MQTTDRRARQRIYDQSENERWARTRAEAQPVQLLGDEPSGPAPAEVDRHLEAVLRASGSSLRYFCIQKTLDDMRAAMRTAMAAGGQA